MAHPPRRPEKTFALMSTSRAVRLDAMAPPHPMLNAVVIIPARNEADLLPLALRALRGQVDQSGRAVDPRRFEVLVLANNCTDRTAEVARALARSRPDGPPMRVAEADWPAPLAHVGTARRWLMDCAADRLEAVGRPDGSILSTDADTEVAPDWIAAQAVEFANGADAVVGRIEVDPAELLRLKPSTRRSYRRELVYRERILQLEALIDPDPLDPPPRHDWHGGASLGITVQAYRRVGGLPPRRSLEDVALVEALWRVDARLVHSPRVRVRTSLRLDSRAEGGLGHALSARSSEDAPVRSAAAIEAELRTRAELRRLFECRQASRRSWTPEPSSLVRLALTCGLPPERLAAILTGEPTFGRWLEAIRGFGSGPARSDEPRTSIRQANRELHARVRAIRREAGLT